ncbi:hypothetical protein AMTRI_Chr10g4270 [Amborella trichopoda]
MSSCGLMGVNVHGDSHIYLISISPMQASSSCLPSYFVETQCNGGCPGFIGCCYRWCTKHQLNYLSILRTPTSFFFHLLLFLFFFIMFYSLLSFSSPYSLPSSLSPSPYYSLICLSHVSTLSLFYSYVIFPLLYLLSISTLPTPLFYFSLLHESLIL